jgi:RimJ/RimL family protein N-acetyltransferase
VPKHGWKWRTERLRELSEDQLRELLQRHDRGAVSGKVARWVFENLGDQMPFIRFAALERSAHDDRCPWRKDYLWSLLPAYKHDPFGDWIVIALTRGLVADPTQDIKRFIALYRDETAHPITRGSAVFGISNAVAVAGYADNPKPFTADVWSLVRVTCTSAKNSKIPYAREGGRWLEEAMDHYKVSRPEVGQDHQPVPSEEIGKIKLQYVFPEHLPILFEHQLDPAANQMAAFTSPDPTNREAFDAHWARIFANDAVTNRTILVDGQVAGYMAAFERFNLPEVGYWIGPTFWGRGIATEALRQFLSLLPHRPIYARVAHDNQASRRVLEKCGFVYDHTGEGFAAARNAVIEEFVFVLNPDAPSEPQSR